MTANILFPFKSISSTCQSRQHDTLSRQESVARHTAPVNTVCVEHAKFLHDWLRRTLAPWNISINKTIWAASWQNQQNDCAPSKDSDQPGHPPSLIRVFSVHSMGSYGCMQTVKTLTQGYRNFEIQIGPLDRWGHRRHRNMRPTIPKSHEN